MGVMTYSPLTGGWLSGKYRKGHEVSGPGSAARTRRLPARYDGSDPSSAAKLDAADGIDLSNDVRDCIDEIVPPEVSITVADNMWEFGTRALAAACVADRTHRSGARTGD